MPVSYVAGTPDHDEPGQLLLATANGDSAAFEKHDRSTSSRLFGVCLRIIPQRAEAEDVLQEVFTNVWRKATQFDPARASGLTWLTMMARNRAIDHIRSCRASRQSVPIKLADELVDSSPDAQVAAEAMLEGHRLDVCLGELEAPRRQLIRTAFFQGSTYEQLAQRTGTPLGTVKSWIRRSLAKLKVPGPMNTSSPQLEQDPPEGDVRAGEYVLVVLDGIHGVSPSNVSLPSRHSLPKSRAGKSN